MAQLELVIGRIWVGEENERSNIVFAVATR